MHVDREISERRSDRNSRLANRGRHCREIMMSKEENTAATSPVAAQAVALQSLQAAQPQGAQLLNGRLDLISELKVRIEARLGDAEISVGELFGLRENSVVPLEAAPTDPVDLLLDGKLIARGALVVVGETFGIRITEISDAGKSA